MSRRILITRPEPGATRTAERLAAAGFEPIVMPLMHIVATHATVPGGPFDAVMATSANALRHLSSEAPRALFARPLHAVGKATAAAARERGFTDIRQGDGTACALAGHIAAAMGAGARLLYLTSRVRTASAETVLAAAGIAVTPLEVYDTVEAAPRADDLAKILNGMPVDAALIYSQAVAKALGDLVLGASAVSAFESTMFLCLSERIARGLPLALRARARIAPLPDEDALVALL